MANSIFICLFYKFIPEGYDNDDINHAPGARNLPDYEMIPMEEQFTFWDFPADEKIKEILEEIGKM